MKRCFCILPLAFGALTLTGCVEEKAKPRLDSPVRSERIDAVRKAQNEYGAVPAQVRPVPSAEVQLIVGDDTKLLPIDGPWVIMGRVGEEFGQAAATIKDGELRVPGATVYWKNIRQVPNSPARYSAVRVGSGLLWGTREDPVEFYLDADGILHHDDAQLGPLLRCTGIITLRRP